MIDLITSLTMARKLDFSSGDIKYNGTSLSLIPPQVYVALLKELRKQNKESIIYESSKKTSYDLFSEIGRSKNKTSVDLLSELSTHLNLLSLGEVRLEMHDETNNRYEFVLANSLTAELYGNSDSPVDVQFSGLLAGALSFIASSNIDCEEVECVSTGSKFCKFIASVKK